MGLVRARVPVLIIIEPCVLPKKPRGLYLNAARDHNQPLVVPALAGR